MSSTKDWKDMSDKEKTLEAVDRIEGDCEDENLIIQAWQYLIDEGHAWKLQGFYGRTASRLIHEGVCSAPKPPYTGTPRPPNRG